MIWCKKVVAHTDHHVHMAGFHQLLLDVAVFAGAVGGGGSHNKSCPPTLVQIGVKIGDPEIVCAPHRLGLVDRRQAKGQTPRALGEFRIDFIYIKGWICHHIIAATVQIVGVVVEGVGLIAGLDNAVKP